MPTSPTINLAPRALDPKRLNIPHAKNATWPVEKKIEAVTTWLALGSLKQAAAVTGISHGLIKNWRMAPWWKEVEAEIIASRRVKSATKLAKIVDKSLDVIEDRLIHGDFIWDSRSSMLHRKPVSLRDATTTANGLMQREAIIEKLNRDEAVVEATASIQDQLKGLAEEFAKFNSRHKQTAETIRYTPIEETLESLNDQRDAVPTEGEHHPLHDKWETGLQEGEREVRLSSLGSQEEDGTEQGSPGNGESRVGPQGRWESSRPYSAPV